MVEENSVMVEGIEVPHTEPDIEVRQDEPGKIEVTVPEDVNATITVQLENELDGEEVKQ